MIVEDERSELPITKIKTLEEALEKLSSDLDWCDQEMNVLDNGSMPFSADRLMQLSMKMALIFEKISDLRIQLDIHKKILSN